MKTGVTCFMWTSIEAKCATYQQDDSTKPAAPPANRWCTIVFFFGAGEAPLTALAVAVEDGSSLLIGVAAPAVAIAV